jgi:hypothetical protein
MNVNGYGLQSLLPSIRVTSLFTAFLLLLSWGIEEKDALDGWHTHLQAIITHDPLLLRLLRYILAYNSCPKCQRWTASNSAILYVGYDSVWMRGAFFASAFIFPLPHFLVIPSSSTFLWLPFHHVASNTADLLLYRHIPLWTTVSCHV